jgi:broad specificity phosphatase PhoE
MEDIRVLLCRHGHTRDNAELGELVQLLDGGCMVSEGKVLSGQNAVSLSTLGLSQAVAAGQSLLDWPWAKDALWLCSPQLRAMQTLSGICCGARLNQRQLRLRQTTGLMERDAGDVTGLTWSEAAEVWPEMSRGKDASTFTDADAPYPGGESLRMVHARAIAAVARHLATDNRLVVVCHELTVKALLAEFLHGELDNRAFEFAVPNAQFIELRCVLGVWERVE